MEGKQEANNINGVKGVCFDGGIPECNGLCDISSMPNNVEFFFLFFQAAVWHIHYKELNLIFSKLLIISCFGTCKV